MLSQTMWTSCACLASRLSCFLHAFTQLSLWRPYLSASSSIKTVTVAVVASWSVITVVPRGIFPYYISLVLSLQLHPFGMPYQILCNGAQQKSPEARSGLALTPSRYIPLYNNRDGIQIFLGRLPIITFLLC